MIDAASPVSRRLTRHRIASGFDSDVAVAVAVAAKSGDLLGVVRNEAGVVTIPSGEQYAVGAVPSSEPSSGLA